MQTEDNIIASEEAFAKKVQAAFEKHCDEIHQRAKSELEALAPDDVAGRKAVLDKEKADLDQTVSELKEVISFQEKAMNEKLEALDDQKEENNINLEQQLAQI